MWKGWTYYYEKSRRTVRLLKKLKILIIILLIVLNTIAHNKSKMAALTINIPNKTVEEKKDFAENLNTHF